MESLQSFENPAQPRPEAAVISSAGVTEGYGLVFLTILISEGMEIIKRNCTMGSSYRCSEVSPSWPLGNGWIAD